MLKKYNNPAAHVSKVSLGGKTDFNSFNTYSISYTYYVPCRFDKVRFSRYLSVPSRESSGLKTSVGMGIF